MGKPLTGLVFRLPETSISLCLKDPKEGPTSKQHHLSLKQLLKQALWLLRASKTLPRQSAQAAPSPNPPPSPTPGIPASQPAAPPPPAQLWLRTRKPHHALSPKEVRDDFSIQIIHKASGSLVVAATVDEELPPGVFVDEGADLKPGHKARWVFFFLR